MRNFTGSTKLCNDLVGKKMICTIYQSNDPSIFYWCNFSPNNLNLDLATKMSSVITERPSLYMEYIGFVPQWSMKHTSIGA